MERHVFDLACQMARLGHDTRVVAHETYRGHCPPEACFIPFDWERNRWNPMLWMDLRRLLFSLRPQIVHAHGGKAAYALGWAGWPAGTRVVGSVHGTKSQHRAYRRFHAVVAVSRQMAIAIPQPNVRVIHNGIEPRPAASDGVGKVAAWLDGKPRPIVLAVGRLAPVKGFDILLEAWPESSKGTLVLLGEGPERGRLEAIVRRRGLSCRYLLGHRLDLREWMDQADLMVISSRREGFPYVLIEALQAGLPVVSSAVSGASEILPGEWLVPARSVSEMNRMLAWVLQFDKPELATRQGGLFEYARTTLTLKGMATEMERLYAELLTDRGQEERCR